MAKRLLLSVYGDSETRQVEVHLPSPTAPTKVLVGDAHNTEVFEFVLGTTLYINGLMQSGHLLPQSQPQEATV